MSLAFVDDSGETRLSGNIVTGGGATGQVLTQQADKTFAPAAGGGAVTRATFRLTQAQVRGLGTTPVTIIPAPAAGTANIPLYLMTFCPLATAYAFAGNLELRFGVDWTFAPSQFQTALTYPDGTDEFSFDPLFNWLAGSAGGPYPGTVAFELHALGAVTLGTGTVTGYVDYLALATT